MKSGKLKPPKKGKGSYKAEQGSEIARQLGKYTQKETKAVKTGKKPKIKRGEAKQLSQMKWWLHAIYGDRVVTELRFDKKRRFRFDIAIPDAKIAVEYEGLNSEKSGHTTLLGYTSDTEKYNLAAEQGWRMYRYTVINYKNVINDIEKALNQ